MYLRCCKWEAWLEIVANTGTFLEIDRCKDGIVLYTWRCVIVVNKRR